MNDKMQAISQDEIFGNDRPDFVPEKLARLEEAAMTDLKTKPLVLVTGVGPGAGAAIAPLCRGWLSRSDAGAGCRPACRAGEGDRRSAYAADETAEFLIASTNSEAVTIPCALAGPSRSPFTTLSPAGFIPSVPDAASRQTPSRSFDETPAGTSQ